MHLRLRHNIWASVLFTESKFNDLMVVLGSIGGEANDIVMHVLWRMTDLEVDQ